MSKVALLTGISGFIGNGLAKRLLDANWNVHAIIREETSKESLKDLESKNNCTLHIHDGSTESMVRIHLENHFDIVFHLASLYLADHKSSDVSGLIRSNIEFSTQLLQGMYEGGCKKIINIGSYNQHNNSKKFNPFNLYASTKEAFQDILYFYHLEYDFSCLTLKLFDTYGPGDTRGKLINLLVESIRYQSHLELSPGDQIIDLSHVTNIIDHISNAGTYLNENEKTLWDKYLISGERLTIKDLVARLEIILDKNFLGQFGGRPYRNREIMKPIEARKIPPWSSKVKNLSLDEGIQELLDK